MFNKRQRHAYVLSLLCLLGLTSDLLAQAVLPVWPALAPGETSDTTGTELPSRSVDNPKITRVEKIRQPTLAYFAAKRKPTGAALLIVPGGGFGYVVTDLEGSEAANRLCDAGIACFVLNYRTNEEQSNDEPSYARPLQDIQRALRVIRQSAGNYHIDVEKVGVLGFSAGGQATAVALAKASNATYQSVDDTDDFSCAANFAMLIYPWQVLAPGEQGLLPAIDLTPDCPPTFIVHTHDDASTSLGAVAIYTKLKQLEVSAELHIYETGGHGYGVRAREGSYIHTWMDRGLQWLQLRGLAN